MELNWEYLSPSGFVLYADTHRTEAHLSSHCDIVAETKMCIMGAGMGRKQSVSAHDTICRHFGLSFYLQFLNVSVCVCAHWLINWEKIYRRMQPFEMLFERAAN